MPVRDQHLMESAPGPETVIDGRRYLYFGGTSYFGLHGHPALIRAGIDAWGEFGTNTATLRKGMGTSPAHLDVEAAVAEFFDRDDAAYLASGYLSNAAGLQALHARGDFDVIFVDEQSHYCVVDAANMIGVPLHTFAHRDPGDLERKIRENLEPGRTPLVMSDGMFPTIGEIAPLVDYLDIVEDVGGIIWLDDAHPAGILGSNGRGTTDHFGVRSDRVYSCGTLGKAFGGFGGFIAGPTSFIDDVRRSPVMIGASAPPSPIAAATCAGVRLVAENPQWREQLWDNARYLKRGLDTLGLDIEPDDIPVAAFKVGDHANMRRVFYCLMKRGICIQLTDYPGAGADGMLRLVVFSTHTLEQIDRLTDELRRLL